MSAVAQPAAAELRTRQPRAASRLHFLEAVFAGAEVGQVAFWRLSDRRARWLPVQRLDEAAEIPTTTDIYLTVALHDQELALQLAGQTDPSLARGSIGSAVAIPGLWADIDVHGPAHKRQDLPKSFAEAHALVEAFPLQPAVVVNTGNGLQAWWLFKEPWTFDGPDDHTRAQRLVRRFDATLQAEAREHGWALDDISDLARVLRLPETTNTKLGERRPVEIVAWHPENRFEPVEFERYLVDEPQARTHDRRERLDTAAVLPASLRATGTSRCSGWRASSALPTCPKRPPKRWFWKRRASAIRHSPSERPEPRSPAPTPATQEVTTSLPAMRQKPKNRLDLSSACSPRRAGSPPSPWAIFSAPPLAASRRSRAPRKPSVLRASSAQRPSESRASPTSCSRPTRARR